MNEGETSGAPTPVDTSQNNETPVAAPVFSAPADGEAPAAPADPSAADNTESSQNIASRAFGFKARSRRNTAARADANYAAAQNIANNPNTPDFFGDAMKAAAPAPEPKKSKKPLVIGGIAGAILVAVTVIVLLFVRVRGGKQDTHDINTSAIQAFCSLLLYGNESTTDFNEDAWGDDAYIIKEFAKKSSDEKKDYANRLAEVFSGFADSVYNSTKEKSDDSALNVRSQTGVTAAAVDSVVRYSTVKKLNESDIISAYVENPSLDTAQYVENYYSVLASSDLTSDEKYIQYYVSYAESIKNLYNYAVELGCASDHSTIDHACLSTQPAESKTWNEITASANSLAEARQIERSARLRLLSSARVLYKEIQEYEGR